MYQLVDCHSHTHFAAFEKDYKEVIQRSLDAGVALINVGTQIDTSRRAIEVAHQYAHGVYAAVGLHPTHTNKSYHDAQELGDGDGAKAFVSRGEEFDFDAYLKMAQDEKVVAIGECGLDYYRTQNQEVGIKNQEIKERQTKVFLQHVEIAKQTGKALMIHCRPSKGTDDAYQDLYALLQTTNYSLPTVLHFYVGSVEMTKKFIEAGFNFEFGGVVTFTRDYDEQIKMIPLDRILFETDAPYVAPVPYRGKRNEPAYVVEVAKKVAELKGISYDKMSEIEVQNAKRIFNISL